MSDCPAGENTLILKLSQKARQRHVSFKTSTRMIHVVYRHLATTLLPNYLGNMRMGNFQAFPSSRIAAIISGL